MNDVVIPASLMWIVVVIALFIQLLRLIPPVDKYSAFMPYVSVGAGILMAALCGESKAPGDYVMIGVAIGAMASAGYDVFKAPAKLLFPNVAAPKILPIILILGLLCMATGCGEVRMSPRYSMLLDQSAIDVAAWQQLCDSGDCDACREGLQLSRQTLDHFVAAKNGTAPVEKGGE